MARAPRKPHGATLAFAAITIEGALIAPAMLARIAEQKAVGQSDADYNIPKGLTLRDEVARYFRIGQALFKELFATATPSTAATTRFVEALLRDVFGFADISRAGVHMLGERLYPVTLEACGGRVPVVVVPPSDEIDAPSLYLPSEGRRRSAASALQDWLNASEGALWGLCGNGVQLRLVRANASLTRPAFIEADLRRIFEGEAFADFAALWLLIHASRFGAPGTALTDCALERWRDEGGKEGVAARKRLRDGVEAALLSLGGGFLAYPDNSALRERVASVALPLPEYFGQLLCLVYRLIFLLTAEDKGLLHPPSAPAAARKLYAEGYSVGAIRDRAVRRAAWDRHHEIATRVARHRAEGVASAEDYRHALREVVQSCIHGVDRNPLAVELTKVALWIETVDPGKPLGFLDANIRCGDSLLGVFDLDALRHGIPDAAYKPLAGDDKETAKYFEKRNKDARKGQGTFDFTRGGGRLVAAAPLAATARALRAMPEDSPEDIAAKRRRFQAAQRDPRSWSLHIAADLYTAGFLIPKTGGVPANRNTVLIPTTEHVWTALAGQTVYGPLVGRAQELTGAAHAFHWPLEFPDVVASGGFDIVLGNPPWERIKLQEQEFFAAREPEIANAPNAAARGKLIAQLKGAEPGSRDRALYEEFETAKRAVEAASVFARVPEEDCGRFPLTGRGDINTYALFAELFATLTGLRGRAGVIVPTGIATDATTAPFFAMLVQEHRLGAVFSFENEEMIFPGIHHAMKFCLLVLKSGQDVAPVNLIFYARGVGALSDPGRRFTLSTEDIARINPNTKTAPVFRSRADAELTAKIYAHLPVLIDDTKGAAGNPWGVSFMRMFDMSNDSGLFRTAVQLAQAGFIRDGTDWTKEIHYLPLYEAKMGDFYDHRAAGYDERGDDRGYRVLPETSTAQHMDPTYEPRSFYWVREDEVVQRIQGYWKRAWLLGFKDITSPTNERTFIGNPLPRWGVGNNMPLLLPDQNIKAVLVSALLASISSIVFDYFARQKAGGLHLNYFYVKQFPVHPPSAYSQEDLVFILPRVLELAYTSHSMAPFARDLGYNGSPFAWTEERRALLRAELDAWYARAYGLTRDELRYILDPADVMGPDYPSETFRVLKNNEKARYGEYRTAPSRARRLGRAGGAADCRPMIKPEDPPGFLVRTEAQKAAWDHGFRLERGIESGGWLRYASTTAHGEIWLAGVPPRGPWLLSVNQPGVVAELMTLRLSPLPGPGLATFDFDSLTALHAGLDRVYKLSVSLPDAPLARFRAQTAGLPQTTEVERLAVQRIGQEIFRGALMDYWGGRCPITGITDPALLRASHIVPWADCEDAQRLDVHNGLLLSALWDAAFDEGLVGFADDGTALVRPNLSSAARAALGIAEAPRLPNLHDAHRVNLAAHRARHGFSAILSMSPGSRACV
jgi:hypothetical protein